MSSRKPYVRKRYWNEPEMGWYERAYFFEVWRGIRITGGVFLANLWKSMTGRKGALTAYYPEETPRRLRRAQPRQAHPDAASRRPPAVRRLQHVRHGVPGAVHRDRRRVRPRRPRAPEVSVALRDRLLALRVLRAVRRGVPGGRDPHAKETPELPGFDRGRMWITQDELLNWQPRQDVAKPYPATPARRPEGTP